MLVGLSEEVIQALICCTAALQRVVSEAEVIASWEICRRHAVDNDDDDDDG
jgi:hypothetical protein